MTECLWQGAWNRADGSLKGALRRALGKCPRRRLMLVKKGWGFRTAGSGGRSVGSKVVSGPFLIIQ